MHHVLAYFVRLLPLFVAPLVVIGAAHGACLRNDAGDVRLHESAATSAEVLAVIPARSCRVAVESQSCARGNADWCKASFDGKFGWIRNRFLEPRSKVERQSMNYYVLEAVYTQVAPRHSRGYNLHRSFTQNLNYSTFAEIKSYYYKNGQWVFPGSPSESMCVAAVAEVLVETINTYVKSTGDDSAYDKLPAVHFSYNGRKKKHLVSHIYEFDGMGSKGVGHALERFDIGKEKAWPDLVPGDFIKFSRSGKQPGHSTVFIGYVNRGGQVLERYSGDAVGFRFFSAQGSGEGADGKPVKAGMSFRNEYFDGKCGPGVGASRCAVLGPEGKYGVNAGSVFYPDHWGIVGRSYEQEVKRSVIAALPPCTGSECGGARSLEIQAAVKISLEQVVDPGTLPNWEQD